MDELLAEFPVVVDNPVIWGDMDAYEHVNNTVYFRYFETARIEFFDKLNFKAVKDETGIGPILASTECRFRIPLTHPDTVSIGARVVDIKEDRFTMIYRVVSHQHQKIAAEGEGLIIAYDYLALKKATLPSVILDGLASLNQ